MTGPQPDLPSSYDFDMSKIVDKVTTEAKGAITALDNILKNGLKIGEEAVPIIDEASGKPLASMNRGKIADRTGLLKDDNNSGQIVHRYPAELGDDENPHYVMFFINIPQSRLSEAGGDAAALAYYDPTSINRINTNDSTTLPIAGGALGTAVGLVSLARAGGAAVQGDLGGAMANTFKAGAAAVVGAGVGAVAGSFVNKSLNRQPHVLLKDCIALHVQSKPSTAYSANWSDQDLGALGSISQNGGDQLAKYLGREALLKAAMIPKLAGLGFDFRSYVEKAESRVNNPHKEQLFRSMGMRKFGFEYVFAPKSIEETYAVEDIIRIFKTYMHPMIDPSRYFLVYPGEFNIIHYYKDSENTHLHKITSCALTDMKVEYGGENFHTFRDTGGAPTEIFMSLTFVEMEMLTSERAKAGY